MNNVNKTLYIPLYGKALVSKKGIILNDKKAEEIWQNQNFKLKGKSKSKTKVTKENKQAGIVYNVPERATVKVYTNSQTLAEETLSVSQFGNTETLSSTFFSKKKNIKVTLDPHTGALLKVEEQTN
jgi:hypothetical protein